MRQRKPLLFIGAQQTRQRLPFERLIPALRAMFIAEVVVPERAQHRVDDRLDATLLVMPAWLPGRYLGVKLVNVFPRNRDNGSPALSATYLLSDATTGEALALIDGDELTRRRTAAASALAASYLARQDASTLLVVGAGRIGTVAADAYGTVCALDRVLVWDRTPGVADRLVTSLRGRDVDARRADDLAVSAGQADIITCATLSTTPLIRGAWLRPGTHLDLVGSFTPAMREADDDALARASVFIDTPAALEESGDLVEPLRSGALAEDGIRATLTDLCRGARPGRREKDEVTVFKSVGTAIEDLAAAALVYEDNVTRPRTREEHA